jgi:hypothetical protein
LRQLGNAFGGLGALITAIIKLIWNFLWPLYFSIIN